SLSSCAARSASSFTYPCIGASAYCWPVAVAPRYGLVSVSDVFDAMFSTSYKRPSGATNASPRRAPASHCVPTPVTVALFAVTLTVPVSYQAIVALLFVVMPLASRLHGFAWQVHVGPLLHAGSQDVDQTADHASGELGRDPVAHVVLE